MNDVIASRHVAIDGRDYQVRLYRDTDTTPSEFECYDETDIAAWHHGDWEYVIVEVAAICGCCGNTSDDAMAMMSAVEYGRIGTRHNGDDLVIDLDAIINGDYMTFTDADGGNPTTVTMVESLAADINAIAVTEGQPPAIMECSVGPYRLEFVIEVPQGGTTFTVVDAGTELTVFGPHRAVVGHVAGLNGTHNAPRRPSARSARQKAFALLAQHGFVR